MKHEDSKSEFVRKLAHQYGTNHSTRYFVEKCKALGENVSPQSPPGKIYPCFLFDRALF